MFLYGSVDAALESMSGRFDEMYAKGGRPSIAPERLLRALLQAHGQESRLAYLGHVMMDNRHGLAIDTLLTEANGRAERDAALAVAAHLPGRNKRVTLGADKGYDTLDFVKGAAIRGSVAQNISGRSSRIDERPHATMVIATAKGNASSSNRSSAGSRPLPVCAKPSTAAVNV